MFAERRKKEKEGCHSKAYEIMGEAIKCESKNTNDIVPYAK